MEIINWGIIGCGDVTEVKSGPAFSKVPHSSLIAVMRRNRGKAKDYALRHKVPRWYTDARQLIEDPEVNAIYVATPPQSHEEYSIAALHSGKPVYLEKPMATTVEACKRIVNAVQDSRTKLTVAHYRREQPMFKKIKSLLDSHVLGDIRLVNLQLLEPPPSPEELARPGIQWRVDPAISGGGLFHDLAPHQLDLMYHFFGKPKEAYGTALNQSGLYAADDIVSGNLLFENNILFSGTWCFSVPAGEKRDSCEIIGSGGKILFSVFGKPSITLSLNGQVDVLHFDTLPHVQQPMIEKVVKYFLNYESNPCSAEEGMAVMELIDQFTKK